MTFKIDYVDGTPVTWTLTENGVEHRVDHDYRPRMYVGVRDGNQKRLDGLCEALAPDPKIESLTPVERFTELKQDEPVPVLEIGLERVGEIVTLAREVRNVHESPSLAPGTYELFNVDFSPQFRYCLETRSNPAPTRKPETLELTLSEKAIADNDLTQLQVEGETVDGKNEDVLATVEARVAAQDPDVLVLSTAQIIPVLYQEADKHDLDGFELGRIPGWQQLAGESTFESYGRIGYSAARFNVPGRAILDQSNSFLWNHSGIEGILDLVERSWKPFQEAAWGSIGNLLTAIQIREALERDILIPWNKSDPELEKPVEVLHAADRGGHTFEPDTGIHEDVHELDFASMYPNIMVEYNISPETVRCSCHDREDVPEFGYSICDEPGFVPQVLKPMIQDRGQIQQASQGTEDSGQRATLEAKSEALKWVLITCFGYQGYSNSKFGRIEAHEAINAYARDILLHSKEVFESNDWRVVHGIVDSIWVTPRKGEEQRSLDELAQEITDEVSIRLEYEQRYDWICFVPMRNSEAGALTKYFGKKTGINDYKIRGIEIRQRSTPKYVEDRQRKYLDILDQHRSPEAVLNQLQHDLNRLRNGDVPIQELVIKNKASKPLEAYCPETLVVSALHRYKKHGIEKSPGQDVQYVVDDNQARLKDRVRLPFETVESYDTDHYSKLLIRAAESIVSPLGWKQADINQYLRETNDSPIWAYE